MKKYLYLLLLLVLITLQPTVFAIETSTSSATPSSTTQSDIETKIKTIVKDSLTNTEKTLTQNSNLLLGYKGLAKSVGNKSITLETDKDVLQVQIADNTQILKNNLAIKISAIAIADNLLVYGQQSKSGYLDAKMVIVLPKSTSTENDIVITQSVITQIKKIDTSKKTFTLNIEGIDQQSSLSKKSNIKLETFKDGDTVFAIIKKYQGKVYLSRAIKI